MPTASEGLMRRDIGLINSLPYRPQTNGKPERFHAIIEAEIGRHDGLEDCVGYYNNRRLHFSLDTTNIEMPLAAWRSRQASGEVCRANPRWMEEERERAAEQSLGPELDPRSKLDMIFAYYTWSGRTSS